MKRLMILVALSIVAPCDAAQIAILSWHGYIAEKTFLREKINRPFRELKKIAEHHGHMVKFVDTIEQFETADYIVLFNIQLPFLDAIVKKYPDKPKLLYIWEPPVIDTANYIAAYHQYFSRIFTWDDDLINKNPQLYKKLYYVIDNLAVIKDLVPFEKRKLCTLIAGNKNFSHVKELYSERLKAIKYFERFHPYSFDFYGRDWPWGKFKTYQGAIKNKTDYLKQYKFCICYENMREIKGYITEKIFDCFIAGCVPIYLGAENIADYIPKECFIDRRNFKSYDELYAYLRSINKQQFDKYIRAIKTFCTSAQAQKFSIDYFAKKLFSVVESSINSGPSVDGAETVS